VYEWLYYGPDISWLKTSFSPLFVLSSWSPEGRLPPSDCLPKDRENKRLMNDSRGLAAAGVMMNTNAKVNQSRNHKLLKVQLLPRTICLPPTDERVPLSHSIQFQNYFRLFCHLSVPLIYGAQNHRRDAIQPKPDVRSFLFHFFD
jgi:hypothetical protein